MYYRAWNKSRRDGPERNDRWSVRLGGELCIAGEQQERSETSPSQEHRHSIQFP
jgi:hypothetical protein